MTALPPNDPLYDAQPSLTTPAPFGIYDADEYSYDGPSYWFTPPIICDVPRYLPDTPFSPALGLFRHYTNLCRGTNVAICSDGSVVQETGTEENMNDAWPYPWNPYDPSGPFARVYDFKSVESDYYIKPYVVTIFYGGHGAYQVDQQTYEILKAAGYTYSLEIKP